MDIIDIFQTLGLKEDEIKNITDQDRKSVCRERV